MEIGYLIRMNFKTPVSSTITNKEHFQYLHPKNYHARGKHTRLGWKTIEETKIAMQGYIKKAKSSNIDLHANYNFYIIKVTVKEEVVVGAINKSDT